MTGSVDDLIASAQTRTLKVSVCARGDLVNRHAELVDELNTAIAASSDSLGNGNRSEIDRLHAEVDAVEAEQEESTTEFTLTSIGALSWSSLLRKHPPPPEVKGQLAFNLASFPPAAVAACVVEPEMTEPQAARLYDVLPSGEWDKLFAAAFTLNEQGTPHPKLSAAIGNLLRSGQSSTTAAPTESLAKPSSDDSNAP